MRLKLALVAAFGILPLARLAIASDVIPWPSGERSSPDFTWTGLYVGASAGFASYHLRLQLDDCKRAIKDGTRTIALNELEDAIRQLKLLANRLEA